LTSTQMIALLLLAKGTVGMPETAAVGAPMGHHESVYALHAGEEADGHDEVRKSNDEDDPCETPLSCDDYDPSCNIKKTWKCGAKKLEGKCGMTWMKRLCACTCRSVCAKCGCVPADGILVSYATQIGHSAFKGCYGLKSVFFPEATLVDNEAFHYATALTEASFPAATKIGALAFAEAHALTRVCFPPTAEVYGDGGNAVFNNAGTSTVTEDCLQ